jgi:hypothetical protein
MRGGFTRSSELITIQWGSVVDCESFFHKTFSLLEIVSETTRFVIPSESEGF